jgi:phenylpyruvate tautomerase PptA (4-oxalocrotonate tautomerase family)
MPTLRVITNVDLVSIERSELLASASRLVADLLGKPESYVMVILEGGRDLSFASSEAPAAYLELKSIGLPESRTPELAGALCDWLAEHLAIPSERVYIEFAAPARHLFGWNGGTF